MLPMVAVAEAAGWLVSKVQSAITAAEALEKPMKRPAIDATIEWWRIRIFIPSKNSLPG
jgi:hypothetical protein